IVAVQRAIGPDFPNSAPLLELNSFGLDVVTKRWCRRSLFPRHSHRHGNLSFLRAYGLEGFPEPHDRADEFFRIIIDIPIVMLMTGQRHRLDKTYPEVIDKARL